jgi:phosphate transport system substrate-binding protein
MKQTIKKIITVLLGLSILACVLGGAFLILLSFAFGGASGGTIMSCLAFVVIVLQIFAIYQMWGKMKPKARFITFGTLTGIPLVVVLILVLHTAYHDSIDTVEQNFNLRAYAPFQENSKAVSLDEPSTLKLTDDLPRLDGATALFPVYSAFVQAIYPEAEYYDAGKEGETPLRCTSTAHAYDNLIKGKTDIIFVAGISEEHRQFAEESGVELVFTPIGREAFVFFVTVKNPVSSLTSEQLRAIYAGRITNWREVGGKNKKITAYQREANSGSQTMFIEFMEGTPIMDPPVDTRATGMGAMIEVVAYKNYNNALGYSFLFYTTEMVQNERIKLLELDGVAPTRENVANGTDPLSSYFYAVTARDNPNPNIVPLIDWILSAQGQSLIEKTGYTPLQ